VSPFLETVQSEHLSLQSNKIVWLEAVSRKIS
jgi:hypothetical protein